MLGQEIYRRSHKTIMNPVWCSEDTSLGRLSEVSVILDSMSGRPRPGNGGQRMVVGGTSELRRNTPNSCL